MKPLPPILKSSDCSVACRMHLPVARSIALSVVLLALLAGCGSRQVEDSLAGSTAQRLVSYAIDDLALALPAEDFGGLTGRRMQVDSSFIGDPDLRRYADRRLAAELRSRFGIEVVRSGQPADHVLQIFYTSLGTDRDSRGFYVPLGALPGVDPSYQIDLLTLQQFHGVAELYYYLDDQRIDDPLTARIRTDSLGLPIITIPLNTLP